MSSHLPCSPAVLTVAIAAGLAPLPAPAADTPVFELGTIVVTATRPELGEVGEEQVASVVTREEMARHNRDNVGEALNLLPGVNLQNNMRNETTITIRGFDARQVPLFIDGIPVYVPYDGYVDLGRFITGDLGAIQVAKGFSSMAYGANTLGGAINLISRRPVEALEGSLSVGAGAGGERLAAANIGSRREHWYMQAGLAWSEADTFPLSDDFEPATVHEDGGDRENAYREDSKVSLKIGYTPDARDEYSLSYYRQDGEKGQPPQANTGSPRFWQWPYWDKEGVYFISRTTLGDKETLKVRLYNDTYDNELNSYTDGTYTTLSTFVGAGGRSIYEDDTVGGSLELESTRLPDNNLKVIAHYKVDEHKKFEGSAGNVLLEKMEDSLSSIALEDNLQLGDRTLASVGISRDILTPEVLFSTSNTFALPSEKSAENAQVGLYFDWNEASRLYATVAKKSRLPTLKDRYSQRMSSFVENPDLRAETALNYEIGYQGTPLYGLRAEAAAFHSEIDDKIQAVVDVVGSLDQMQNVGKSRMSGVELGAHQDFGDRLAVGGSYTLTDLKNISDPDTRLTNVPRHKLVADASFKPMDGVQLVALAEYNSERWVSNTVQLKGFTTINLKAVYRPTNALALEAGADNVGDKNYSLADGFPSPGSSWFARVNYEF